MERCLMRVSSGRQLGLHSCTHVKHAPLSTPAIRALSLWRSVSTTWNSHLSLCCQRLLLLCLRYHCKFFQPPHHLSIHLQASTGDFSMLFSSLLYISVNLSAGSDEVRAWTPNTWMYVLICCFNKHFNVRCLTQINVYIEKLITQGYFEFCQ